MDESTRRNSGGRLGNDSHCLNGQVLWARRGLWGGELRGSGPGRELGRMVVCRR